MFSLYRTPFLFHGSSKKNHSNECRVGTFLIRCDSKHDSSKKKLNKVRDDLNKLLKFANDNCINAAAVTQECKVVWCEIEELSATLSDLKFHCDFGEME